MPHTLLLICGFTFLIHFTESAVYTMRLAGVRTRQVAISLSFVTSALLVSRLSNMGQAPFLGKMVDQTVAVGTSQALTHLTFAFRWVIFAAFLGGLVGAFFAPTLVRLMSVAIHRFLVNGSFIRTALSGLHPRRFWKLCCLFRLPRLSQLKDIHLSALPKDFLILNIFVAAIYTIGVLCALLAGAYLPEMRATAIQLSGIVNGIATILFATVVDPTGARITDQAVHGTRPEADVKAVVVFLLLGRLIGTLLVAQIFFVPFTRYIMWVTQWIVTGSPLP